MRVIFTQFAKLELQDLYSVEKDSYSQKEVADYLGLHYSIICRLLKKNLVQ